MQKMRLFSLSLLLALLAFVFPVQGMAFEDVEGPGGKYHRDNKNINYNRVILTYEKGRGGGLQGRTGLMSSSAGIRNFKHIGAGVVDLSASPMVLQSAKSREDILESYRRLPGVKTAEFEKIYHLKSVVEQENGASLHAPGPHASQWYISSLDLGAAWGAEWGAPYGNGDFVVAVMDTGVDYNHPDLAGAMWKNETEENGIPGVDDDGNGYVDDIYGWDWMGNKVDPMDGHGHGTHVAGIIAGTGASRVTGVASGVKVMALKIFGSDGNGGYESDIIDAIDYVLDQKNASGVDIRAVNMSFGGNGYSQATREAIENLGSAGIATFAAAGNETADNDFIPSFPANYATPALVSVGSLTRSNKISSFSNYGKRQVGVYAYGSDIYSTYKGGGYAAMNGTSMAAPMACGAFLLSWSEDATVSLAGALGRFYAGLIPMNGVGGGRVNVGEMLNKGKNSPAVFKVKDTIVAGDGEFSVFGSYLTDKALDLGEDGLGKTGDLAGGTGVKTRLSPFVSGDLWRRVRRAGAGDGDGPYAMVMEKISASSGGGSGLDNYRPVGKNAMLVLGSETYLFAEKKSPGGTFFLVRLDPGGNLDGEWEFPHAAGSDMEDYLKLFEYGGYIYLPGLAEFTEEYLHRFSLMEEEFEKADYKRSMKPLSHAVFATNPEGTAVYCAGAVHEGGAPAYRYIARFNPDTGELVKLKELPHKLWDTSIAYSDGKIYVAGGERMPELLVFNNTNDCFVYDIHTGQLQEGRKLPFYAKDGVLLFSNGKLIYAVSETNGDGFKRQYVTAMTDLTKSGWVHKWEALPKVYEGALYDAEGGAPKPRLLARSNPGGGLSYLSDQWGSNWGDTVMPIPEGTPQDDPHIPTPDPDDPYYPDPVNPGSGGGGGCNAGGGSESGWMLLGLLPVLLASKKRR